MAVDSGKVPERMCLVCRELKPRDQLFRLVKHKEDGSFTPNADGRIPGKGVYFCRYGDCIDRLQKERRLRRQLAEKLKHGALEWMIGPRSEDVEENNGDKTRQSKSI